MKVEIRLDSKLTEPLAVISTAEINDEVTVYGDFRGMDGSYPSIAVRYYDIDKAADSADDTIVR